MSQSEQTTQTMSVRSNEFFFESVIIQVENTLFRVPWHKLENGSQKFRSCLAKLHEGKAQDQNESEDRILLLKGPSKAEFATFLSILYPTTAKIDVSDRSFPDWSTILNFSTAYGFDSIRQYVIQSLLPGIELESQASWRVTFGRTYNIEGWVGHGFRALVQRKEPLTPTEMATLGYDIASKVCYFREQRLSRPHADEINGQVPDGGPEDVIALEVSKIESSSPPDDNACYEILETSSPLREVDLQRHSTYYLEDIVFLVDGFLYCVPRSRFENGSQIFRDMLSMPQGDQPLEGLSEGNPIALKGIRATEFISLLKVLFPMDETTELLGFSSWSDVASLSEMWAFEDVLMLAINRLTPLYQNDLMLIEQIVAAKRFLVKAWLLDGYLRLVNRSDSPTRQEMLQIGFESALGVGELRERAFSQVHSCSSCSKVLCPKHSKSSGTVVARYIRKPTKNKDVMKVFAEEFKLMIR